MYIYLIGINVYTIKLNINKKCVCGCVNKINS